MIPLETFTAAARDLHCEAYSCFRSRPRRTASMLFVCSSAITRDLRLIAARLFLLVSFIRAVDPHVFCLCLAVGVFSDDLNR